MNHDEILDRVIKLQKLIDEGYEVYFARGSNRVLIVAPPRKMLSDKERFKPRKQYYTDDWRWQG